MADIFISYRRSDSEHILGRIYDHLVKSIGRNKIFKDVDSIPLGANFRDVIESAIGNCELVIVVIGPTWLHAADESGNARLKEPNDFVRIEIEAALAHKIRIIPVLVGGATMPTVNLLPPSIRALTFLNAISVRADPDFHSDIGRLVRSVKRGKKPWVAKVAWLSLVGGAMVVLSIGGLLYLNKPDLILDAGPEVSGNTVGDSNRVAQGSDEKPSKAPAVESQQNHMAENEPALHAGTNIVWDEKTGIVWARNLFVLGNTKELFRKSESGSSVIAQDVAAIEAKASELRLEGLTGWHIATVEEMQTLRGYDGGSIFLAFRQQPYKGGVNDVMGIYRVEVGRMAVWGYQYGNYLQGPYDNAWYQQNELGIWLTAGVIEQPIKNAETKIVRSVRETRTEVLLKPLFIGTMSQDSEGNISGHETTDGIGHVGNLDVRDQREVFLYSLKSIDPGALVQAELKLHPLESSGTGALSISIYESDGTFRPVQGGDWDPPALNIQSTEHVRWDGVSQTRPTLPDHVMRDLFNQQGLVGLHFKYDGNGAIRFRAPELVITYIKQSDLINMH